MLCKEVRHVGIPAKHYEATIKYYEDLGFAMVKSGRDVIDGRECIWRKMTDGILTIELLFGDRQNEPHIALTVDAIDESKYYYRTPSGHRVQFDRDPSGNLVEFVERRAKIENTENNS